MPENHWWIVAKQDGRPILIYGDRNENTARQKGLETLPGIDFKLVSLATSSLPHASQLLRGKVLNEEHDLRSATKRQVHEKGLRQQQRKYRLS